MKPIVHRQLQHHETSSKRLERYQQQISGEQKPKTPSAPVDTKLAVFRDRLTYTFILENEVASIHFDRNRGEIFYKGHSLQNVELNDHQKKVLQSFMLVLEEDAKGKEFLSAYKATLDRYLADKKEEGE